MRVLLLLAAVWGIVEVARWWDALHPLRSMASPGGSEPLPGDSYLDWGILERRRSRSELAVGLTTRGRVGRAGARPAFTRR